MSGILMMPRGTSSPEPPYTLARGGPKAPLRSRDSLAALARGKTASRALTSLEIGAVVQARDPEYEADQEEELEHGHRNDFRREAERRREGVRRVVAHDAVDMPMLAEAGANVAHQSHEPGEGDRDEDQDVHGGVLGGHHAEVAKNRVRPSSHRPEFRHGRDNRSRRCPDHEAERD